MTPWIMVGQTLIQPGQLHLDPVPNSLPGVVGLQTAWPYVVPAGKRLLLSGYGIEGNAICGTIFPILGTLPVEAVPGADQGSYQPWWDKIAKAALYSVAGPFEKMESNFLFELLSGTELHVGLINSSQYPLVHAWVLQGYLVDDV